jgi:hypothetical protein
MKVGGVEMFERGVAMMWRGLLKELLDART